MLNTYSLYQRFVSYITLFMFVVTTNVALIRTTEAAGYISRGGVSQSFTPLNWETIATTVMNSSSTQIISANYTSQGLTDFLNVSGNGSAKALGMTANQVADVINMFPANVPMIFGRFAEGVNEGVIDIFKVEKYGNTSKLLHANFTPENGSYWAAARTYASDSDKSSGASGPNPFSAFRGSDVKFHNASFSTIVVGVGHAMRLLGTPFALIAQETYSMEKVGPKCKKSAGGLRKKCKVWVYGKAKPTWYFATPSSLTDVPSTTAICAINGMGSSCPAHAIAPAMVSFEKKTGGNLQEQEETIYTWYKSYSGWTVLAFVIAVFVMSAAIAAIGGFNGVGLLSNLINGQGITFAGSTLVPGVGLGQGALVIGAIEAAGYAIGAAIFQGGGLDDIQSGFYGKVTDGYSVPTSASGVQERGTRAALSSRMTPNISSDGLGAIRNTASRMRPAAADYTEHNTTSFYTDNGSPLQSSSSNPNINGPQ